MKVILAATDIALGTANLAMYVAHSSFINLVVGAIAIAVGAAILAS